jgi:Ca-activated chloride channel family protein
MRFHTYTKFSPELADAIDLQALLDKLADFLLQSGFAGGDSQSYYGFDGENEGNRSLDALKQAILDALMESGQFTPEMLEALRGGDDDEGTRPSSPNCWTSSSSGSSKKAFSTSTTLRRCRPATNQ